MKARNLIAIPAIAAAVLGGASYFWYQTKYPTCTFRYKITAEVNTPDGVKTGSRVWQVSYAYNPGFGGGPQPVNTVVGDALFVDLGHEKNLFITLTRAASGRPSSGTWGHWMPNDKETGSTNVFGIPLRVLDVHWQFGQERSVCSSIAEKGANRTFDVPQDWLPTLVTFGNMKDPNTSKVVQPEKLSDVFGEGYSLRGVKISLTDDRVNQNLEAQLPWLSEMKDKWSKGHDWYKGEPLVDILNYDAFSGPSTHPDGGATL